MARIFLGFHRGVLDLRFGSENLAALQRLGEVVFNLEDRGLTPGELIERAADCEIVVADRLTPGDEAFFDASPNLVAYVRSVTDMKGIDVAAASRNGILVSKAGPTFVPGVTEWIVGQMINLSRHFFEYTSVYRSGVIPDIASSPKGRQLAEKTAGIIGFGKLGQNLAGVLKALGMRVLVNDPFIKDWPDTVEPVELKTLLSTSDFVICLTGLTVETAGFMNADVFSHMQPSALFINAGRGDLVDETALESALMSGEIAGAALDVGSAAGDMPPVRLARLPNVLATPHIAPSMDANHAQGGQAIAMIRKILKGEVPDATLNAEAATRLKVFAPSNPATVAAPACAAPDPNPKKPKIPTPPGACECHSHIFGPQDHFPYGDDRSYTPPDAPLETYLALHDTLGIDRGVLVQGSAHGTDNSAMLDALQHAPNRLRGVAVVDNSFSDAELQRMSDLGVRGARFNHLLKDGKPVFKGGIGIDDYLAMHDRLVDLNWHLQLWIHSIDLPDIWPRLEACQTPIMIDHMGRIDSVKGLPYPGFDFLLNLLSEGKIWVKLSGIYRGTDNSPDYPESRSFHEALVAANPDQCVWGLDWPHPSLSATMPNDGTLLDLFNEWTPDEDIRRRILVDNPARLYGF